MEKLCIKQPETFSSKVHMFKNVWLNRHRRPYQQLRNYALLRRETEKQEERLADQGLSATRNLGRLN